MAIAKEVSAMTKAIVEWPDGWSEMDLSALPDITDDQLFQLCATNSTLRFERLATGEVIIMPPEGGLSSSGGAYLLSVVHHWAERDGSGVVFGSSGGFLLPNTAMRAPDVAWVRRSRLQPLSERDRQRFLPLGPDFVIELRSYTDRLPPLREKMVEWTANGAQLAWLIDPIERTVTVYRPGQAPESLAEPAEVRGDPELPGLLVDLATIWRPDW